MNLSTRERNTAGRSVASPGSICCSKHKGTKHLKGFTLVELLTVIAIMGILSAVAVPAFIAYLQRAKTSEALSNVQKIYSGAVTYYDTEHVKQGMNAATIVRRRLPCEPSGSLWCPGSKAPGASRFQAGAPCFSNDLPGQGVTWRALDFAVADHHYYTYRFVCTEIPLGPVSGTNNAFIGVARGDLDGDGVFSLFERNGYIGPGDIIVGSPGVFTLNPIE